MKQCLRCGIDYDGRSAISRRDNKTQICPGCGIAEKLFDVSANFIMRVGNAEERKALSCLVEAERAWLECLVNNFMIGS